MAKTPVQKGKIISNPPTMKSMGRVETDREDLANRTLRRSGQTLEMVSPKKKK